MQSIEHDVGAPRTWLYRLRPLRGIVRRPSKGGPTMAGNGNVDKLTPNQTRALSALLTSPSIAHAAETAGVGDRTLRRWLHEDEGFRQAYREQRRASLDAVVGLLEGAMFEAVGVLRDAMQNGTMNHRIRAAGMVLENGLKGLQLEVIYLREFEEVQQRIERLEDLLHERGGSGSCAG
jgi:hypothetical protein